MNLVDVYLRGLDRGVSIILQVSWRGMVEIVDDVKKDLDKAEGEDERRNVEILHRD